VREITHPRGARRVVRRFRRDETVLAEKREVVKLADVMVARYGIANAVTEKEAKELYGTFAVPASGAALFQAAAANLNPWTEAKVDTTNPDRGPLLIISGEKDNTVSRAIANASLKQQKVNQSVTEIVEMPNRGHALIVDSGWREVAQTALTFVERFV
jgi:pimeloyl-ACP methyl ester carboxylesterase